MTKCLVWFVGVFSQFNMYNQDLSKIVLNKNLIKKVREQYNEVYCLVCVKDRHEAQLLEKVFDSCEELKGCKLAFSGYCRFDDILMSKEFYDLFGSSLTHFIDSSTFRLNDMSRIYKNVKCIHISEYLD